MTTRILIAEDEPVTRHLLRSTLTGCGWDVVVCTTGSEAAAQLALPDAPEVAVFDWVMPAPDGLELCRQLRRDGTSIYIILLTSKSRPDEVAQGLEAGADDYIPKPFHQAELLARVRVGLRVSAMQRELRQQVEALEHALANVKQLQGLLPICAYCKRIRNDSNYWDRLESYISDRSEAQFSHGICPSCFERVMKNIDRAKKT